MKKLIFGFGLFALSFAYFTPQSAMADATLEDCKPKKYWKLAQTGPTTYCCVASTNSLDTCSGIPC